MHSNLKYLLLLLVFYLQLIDYLRCESVKRDIKDSTSLSQEAWIYPGKDRTGIHLKWSATGNWANLWLLLSSQGFFTIGRLCVSGVFVIYQEPNFEVNTPDAFDIISGNMRCKRIPENTKSIQPVGSIGSLGFPSITFFEKPHFGSIAHPTTFNQGSYFFSRMDGTHSAIIVGRIPWTIQMKDGFRFCVQPDFDPLVKRPICLIKSFQALLGIQDNPFIEFVKVTHGCEDIADEHIHQIQDCMYWGIPPKLQFGQTSEEDSDAKIGGRTPLGGDFCSNPEKKSLIFNLYKAAITGSLDENISVEWTKLGRNAWRLEFLDSIFSVVMETISPTLLLSNFLSRIREVFIQKLANVWGNETIDEIDLPHPEEDYATLMKQTQDCEDKVVSIKVAEYYRIPMQSAWEQIQNLSDFKGKISPVFERKPTLDIITEMVWMAGQLAGYVCHTVIDKSGSFWALYYGLFNSWYMEPVVAEWTKPTQGLHLIFGGVDYIVEYNKFALFASMLVDVSIMEPPKRPAGLEVDEEKD